MALAALALQRAELERGRARVQQARAMLEHELTTWQRAGLITGYSLREDEERCALRLRVTVDELHQEFVLTGEEAHRGTGAAQHVLCAVRHAVLEMHRRRVRMEASFLRPGELVYVDEAAPWAASVPVRAWAEGPWLVRAPQHLTATEVRERQAVPPVLRASDLYEQWRRTEFRTEFRPPTAEEVARRRTADALLAQRRAEAEARARALFARVAGKAAAEQLERKEGLPLRGSAGGEYALLKQASFCVRRLRDQAELCAVVPGVPLWDHLLGIKLLVEVDEPRFLRTAHVSVGGMLPGAVVWQRVLEQQQQLEEMERLRRQRAAYFNPGPWLRRNEDD